MTTTVKVGAHCAPSKEVKVQVLNAETKESYQNLTLQDGDTADLVVFDDRIITVQEVLKAVPPQEEQEGA